MGESHGRTASAFRGHWADQGVPLVGEFLSRLVEFVLAANVGFLDRDDVNIILNSKPQNQIHSGGFFMSVAHPGKKAVTILCHGPDFPQKGVSPGHIAFFVGGVGGGGGTALGQKPTEN